MASFIIKIAARYLTFRLHLSQSQVTLKWFRNITNNNWGLAPPAIGMGGPGPLPRVLGGRSKENSPAIGLEAT